MQSKTEIIHNSPQVDNQDYFRSENLALAQYFSDSEGHHLVNTSCLYVTDDYSDISIWKENNLIHQCSIQLTTRDLFSHFFELNPKLLKQILNIKLEEWEILDPGIINAQLDLFLRFKGDNWLKNKRPFVEEEEDFQGFLRLMAIGFGGLYYYVGTILGVLYDEKKYKKNEITPVYIGGKGSKLLNWLAIGGQFDGNCEINLLLSRMLSEGSGFRDTEEITRLSQKPQDEVACGLVRSRTKLKVLDITTEDTIISGEDCEINGQLINWRERLKVEGNIEEFYISEELVQLRKFFDEFNLALKELRIDGLTPFPDYQLELGTEANKRLWRETHRELARVLLTIKGDTNKIRPEAPFILALKALMRVLGKEWAGK